MEIFQYRLAIDGDGIEQYYWGLFIKNYFPSYESFWLKHVVPLTNRPDNIHFKTDEELARVNKSAKDLHIAQLSYSAMTNLGRCFDILNIFKDKQRNIIEQRDFLAEGFTRLIGAQDNVFELLERKKNSTYEPFNSISGKTARNNWRNTNGHPLEPIRRYRNNLVHGGIHSSVTGDANVIWFAMVGTEEKYLDWRIITDKSKVERFEKAKIDFITPFEILNCAFEETLKYFENHFKNL